MKKSAKKVLGMLMKGVAFPLYVLFLVTRQCLGSRKAFSSIMQAVSLVPGGCGEWFRRGILQWVTGSALTDSCICFGVLFSDPLIRIGNGVYIGPRCDLGRAEIHNDVIMGSAVHITSGRHQHGFDTEDYPIRDQETRFEKVTVGRGSWVGNQAVICADLGADCVVGAGSVVISPVPDMAVVAGNPAKVIRFRGAGSDSP